MLFDEKCLWCPDEELIFQNIFTLKYYIMQQIFQSYIEHSLHYGSILNNSYEKYSSHVALHLPRTHRETQSSSEVVTTDRINKMKSFVILISLVDKAYTTVAGKRKQDRVIQLAFNKVKYRKYLLLTLAMEYIQTKRFIFYFSIFYICIFFTSLYVLSFLLFPLFICYFGG